MLDQEKVFSVLAEHGVTFFTGVPDSYLNGFCNYALKHCGERNLIAANEGNAVGIACVIAVAALLVWKHRGNIARLAKGEESKLGTKKK